MCATQEDSSILFFLQFVFVAARAVQIANNGAPLRDVARKLRSPVLEVIRRDRTTLRQHRRAQTRMNL
jgi:hypothetical protein